MVRRPRCVLVALALLSACEVDGVVLVVANPGLDAGGQAGLDAQPMPDAEPSLDADQVGLDALVATDAVATSPDAQGVVPAMGVCRIGGAADGFYDSFPDGPLDARWLVADGSQGFGTFRSTNVAVLGGTVLLTASAEAGAAIATRDLFGSATYQVQGRVSDGVELSVWWRRDSDADGLIETASPGQGGDFARVLMRSSDGVASSENQFVLASSLNDGGDHIWRFDRYATSSPAVRFWVDDVARWVVSDRLPTTRAGRMWIVARGNGVVRITNAFITPFGNDGDQCTDGELAGAGLISP